MDKNLTIQSTQEAAQPIMTPPPLRLYSMVCTPVGKDGPVLLDELDLVVEFNFIIAALKSSDATRKVAEFFKTHLPTHSITGVEVSKFQVISNPSDTFVVV